MPRRSTAPKSEVPYLHRKQVEAEAELLIAEYSKRFEPIVSPPVPVDELAELHLLLTLEYLDMATLFPQAEVHGAIWFQEGRIGIANHLDPETYPTKLGRYHFTLAHEIGHWRLHRQHYTSNNQERHLFEDGRERPDVVCRSGDTQTVEWQANAFAAHLLMPRKMIHKAWAEFRDGDDRSVAITELRHQFAGTEPMYLRGRLADDEATRDLAIKEEFCRPLAEKFEVSREAMRIRLEKLGLLVQKKEKTLF